ncbi:MAG: glycosyltransferase family 2 protein [Anaerolineales bacterium]|nr:glycosyltransferase family 2 protein [Anaerolineales bacterium]
MPEKPTRPHQPLVAAIIPAYNEEKNVDNVLAVLRQVDRLDEILLVDDGSRDGTYAVLQRAAELDPRVRLLRHEQNRGKGQAVLTGCAVTSAQFLVLLDADLKDLTPEHVSSLMEPVLEHEADMTLGLFLGGQIHTDCAHWLTPFLTGQRCLQASLLKHVSPEAAQGYGFEIALTVAASRTNSRTLIIPLRGVWHPSSEFHRRGREALVWRARMYAQIVQAWVVATHQRYPNARAFLSSIMRS